MAVRRILSREDATVRGNRIRVVSRSRVCTASFGLAEQLVSNFSGYLPRRIPHLQGVGGDLFQARQNQAKE
jgi:hypothetical protein